MNALVPTPASPVKPHLLFFPSCGELYDWFAEVSDSGKPGVNTALLTRQREFERDPRNTISAHVTCFSCGNPLARYLVCHRTDKGANLLYLRRWPGTKHLHEPSCHSYHRELVPPASSDAGEGAAKLGPIRGDWTPLVFETLDPELRPVPALRPISGRTHSRRALNRRIGPQVSPSIGLRQFACEVLQGSGLCDGHPRYSRRREERDFNGMVKRTLESLQQDAGRGRAGRLLQSLPAQAQMIPWSYLDDSLGWEAPKELQSCVGFGFIDSLGPPNERGARAMTLGNHPDLPVLLPAALLSEFADDPRSPFRGGSLPFRTWVIFVAGRFAGGAWKVHKLAWFRVSEVGLTPIESRNEELMVERLIAGRRYFRRWLIPPPGIGGARIVPDFQLLDTPGKEFIEVAGMMDDAEYAARIARKIAMLGDRLLVWDTRDPLGKFVLPSGTEA